MRKHWRTSTFALSFLVAGTVFAATYYLVSWAFTHEEDAASEYSATMAFFRVLVVFPRIRTLDPLPSIRNPCHFNVDGRSSPGR